MRSRAEPVMILGADGFLGRHLVAYFRDRDWPCHPIGRAAGDFSDFSLVASVFRAAPPVTRIFHVVTRQRTGPVQFHMQAELLQTNARIHLNVLEAWRLFQPQAKLISTGSSCAFPERETPLGEDDFQSGPLHASVSGYGLAKQLLAVGSRAYGEQHGLRWLHVFLATLYGPGDHKSADRSHFMTALLDRAAREQAAGRTTFEIWGSPDTVRDLLYVTDQIEAILAADAVFENDMLNVTSNAPVTIGRVVDEILRSLNWRADVSYPPGSFQGANFKTLDSTRFLGRTGWRPRYDLTSGIAEVLRQDYQVA
jgi:GDP-L-fucose synthase